MDIWNMHALPTNAACVRIHVVVEACALRTENVLEMERKKNRIAVFLALTVETCWRTPMFSFSAFRFNLRIVSTKKTESFSCHSLVHFEQTINVTSCFRNFSRSFFY